MLRTKCLIFSRTATVVTLAFIGISVHICNLIIDVLLCSSWPALLYECLDLFQCNTSFQKTFEIVKYLPPDSC